MSGLPWVRLDSNIYSHDKTLSVLGERGGEATMLLYVFSLAYAGGHATDGFVPRAALRLLGGTPKQAITLVEHLLWEHAEGGYRVINWDTRQESSNVRAVKKSAQSASAKRTNCIRYHGPDCGCWKVADAVA